MRMSARDDEDGVPEGVMAAAEMAVVGGGLAMRGGCARYFNHS